MDVLLFTFYFSELMFSTNRTSWQLRYFQAYISIQKKNNCAYLFESNRKSKFTTRWIREIVKKYAIKAGITKRIHPLLFRYQILTYLTSKGIVDTKIQIISGHKNLESLNIYQDLSVEDIEKEYWDAMKDFPIQQALYWGLMFNSHSRKTSVLREHISIDTQIV